MKQRRCGAWRVGRARVVAACGVEEEKVSEKEFVELSVLSFSDVELRVDFRFVEFPFDFPEHYKTSETHNSMRWSRKHCIVEFLVEFLLSFQNRRKHLRAHTHTHAHLRLCLRL